MEGVVEGNVPLASGLSSSAAMEVASGLAFLAASKEVVQPRNLALMAQSAEINYMGVRCGIMDQFISRLGHPGYALFIDCRTLDFELVPIQSDEYVFVATDSRQSRELADSAYNERRAQCEAAVKQLSQKQTGICALRDVTPEQLEQHAEELDPLVYRRARHVVTENARVLEAVEALRSGDLPRFGQLMDASHESLRDDYGVSSPALDTLVAAAREVEGCLGSRLTGAGFGGCTVSLVRQDRIDAFREHVSTAYQEAHGVEPFFYITRPAAGAGLCTPEGCPTQAEAHAA
jgi:galactokinase